MGGSHSVEGHTLLRQSSTTGHQWEETQECEGESSGLQNTCKCWKTQLLACHPSTQKVGARGPPAGLVGISKLGV